MPVDSSAKSGALDSVAVPPELMKMMQAGAGGAALSAPGGAQGAAPPGMPGAGGAAGGGGAPAQPPRAAPMSTPQDKKGLKAAAQTNVHIAVNMLEEALSAYGSESEEGGSILTAITKLRKLFGKQDSSDLVPAEIMQMVSRMPQMGGGTDLQKMIRQQMMNPQASKPQGQPAAAPAGA